MKRTTWLPLDMMGTLPDPEDGEPVVENIKQCSQQTTWAE